MTNGLIKSILIVIVSMFGLITIMKWNEFPDNNCCKDIRNENNTMCVKCDEMKNYEKVAYIWKYLR